MFIMNYTTESNLKYNLKCQLDNLIIESNRDDPKLDDLSKNISVDILKLIKEGQIEIL